MYKVINAAQVKKLPKGTKIYLIDNSKAHEMPEWYVVGFAGKKMIRREDRLIKIKDYEGHHYEVEV